jgi:hypothetical protein
VEAVEPIPEDVPAPGLPPKLGPLPGTETAAVVQPPGAEDLVSEEPIESVQPPLEEAPPVVPPTKEAPTPEPKTGKGALEEWEENWMSQYNLSPQELIGEDLYEKLSKASEKEMSLGEIIGIIGVMATNPVAGRAMIARHDADKREALGALVNLQGEVTKFKRAGLAEYARGKRQEAKEEAYMDRILAKADLESAEKRAQFSANFMKEVAQEGLPQGLILPPTPEQIEDPTKFQQWLGGVTDVVSQHFGKDKLLSWLMDPKGGPSWLAAEHAIDPTSGVMNVLKESGYFSPEELEDIQTQILPQYAARAAVASRQETATLAEQHTRIDRNVQQARVLYERAESLQKRRDLIGEMTPAARGRLIRDTESTLFKMRESQLNMVRYAEHYNSLKNADDYEKTIESNLETAKDMDTRVIGLETMLMELKEEAYTGYMERAQALPIAMEMALTDTMRMYSGSFDGDMDAAKAVFYSDFDDPEFREERRMFFINLLISMRELTGGSWQDTWSDITMGAEGASLLDVEAGRDVVEPGGIPGLSEAFYNRLQTSPREEPNAPNAD